VVDETIVAARVAAIRDAVDRIRGVLPREPEAFEADRTSREVVILNLFVALQESVSLATHWLADAGLDVPGSYREIFLDLASSPGDGDAYCAVPKAARICGIASVAVSQPKTIAPAARPSAKTGLGRSTSQAAFDSSFGKTT
jgi:hypothetical protein